MVPPIGMYGNEVHTTYISIYVYRFTQAAADYIARPVGKNGVRFHLSIVPRSRNPYVHIITGHLKFSKRDKGLHDGSEMKGFLSDPYSSYPLKRRVEPGLVKLRITVHSYGPNYVRFVNAVTGPSTSTR
jgi:hypothetical protein